MNYVTIREAIYSAGRAIKPYAQAFGAFVWAHKTYSLVTFTIGVLVGFIL